MGNTFGKLFRLTTFGESHGKALGAILDGCPAGLTLDLEKIRSEMQRRKPGQSKITTQRKEEDEIELLSGVFEGKTTGTPIGILIPNEDQKSKDYAHIADAFRPSHADFTYFEKYGHRDHRGGGRSSARETAARVAGGAIAKQLLATKGITIQAYVSQVGEIRLETPYTSLNLERAWCKDPRFVVLDVRKAYFRKCYWCLKSHDSNHILVVIPLVVACSEFIAAAQAIDECIFPRSSILVGIGALELQLDIGVFFNEICAHNWAPNQLTLGHGCCAIERCLDGNVCILMDVKRLVIKLPFLTIYLKINTMNF